MPEYSTRLVTGFRVSLILVPGSRRPGGGFIPVGNRCRFAGNTVFIVDPTAQINQLAVFGTEGTVWIVLPLNGLAAIWTLHENSLIVAAHGMQFSAGPAIWVA